MSGSRRFSKFCNTFTISPAYPVNEKTLSRFAAHLFSDGLIPGTIKHYLVAVRHTQISLGYGDPQIGGMARLEYIIKGAKLHQGDSVGTVCLSLLGSWRESRTCGCMASIPVILLCFGQPRACASLASCK